MEKDVFLSTLNLFSFENGLDSNDQLDDEWNISL
jgi:hypothetical protein